MYGSPQLGPYADLLRAPKRGRLSGCGVVLLGLGFLVAGVSILLIGGLVLASNLTLGTSITMFGFMLALIGPLATWIVVPVWQRWWQTHPIVVGLGTVLFGLPVVALVLIIVLPPAYPGPRDLAAGRDFPRSASAPRPAAAATPVRTPVAGTGPARKSPPTGTPRPDSVVGEDWPVPVPPPAFTWQELYDVAGLEVGDTDFHLTLWYTYAYLPELRPIAQRALAQGTRLRWGIDADRLGRFVPGENVVELYRGLRFDETGVADAILAQQLQLAVTYADESGEDCLGWQVGGFERAARAWSVMRPVRLEQGRITLHSPRDTPSVAELDRLLEAARAGGLEAYVLESPAYRRSCVESSPAG